MAQKSEIFKSKVTQVGYWNYNDVYAMLYTWLKDKSYTVKEKTYKEKLTGAGKEIIIDWEADKKITDYFKFSLSLKWHILTMKDAEVEIDGKKEKTNKGELEIEIKAEIIKDYESKWEDKPIHKFMRALYENYVIRTTVDEYEDRLVDDAVNLVSDLKAFLRIPT